MRLWHFLPLHIYRRSRGYGYRRGRRIRGGIGIIRPESISAIAQAISQSQSEPVAPKTKTQAITVAAVEASRATIIAMSATTIKTYPATPVIADATAKMLTTPVMHSSTMSPASPADMPATAKTASVPATRPC